MGRAAEVLVPAADELGKIWRPGIWPEVESPEAQLLLEAFMPLPGAAVQRWMLPVAEVEEFDGQEERRFDWPGFNDEVDPAAGEHLTFSLAPSSGVMFEIDEAGEPSGTGAILTLHGGFSAGAEMSAALFGDPGFSIDLTRGFEEELRAEYSIGKPARTVAATALRSLSLLPDDIEDLNAVARALTRAEGGVRLARLRMTRRQDHAHTGALEVPVTFKVGAMDLSGAASLRGDEFFLIDLTAGESGGIRLAASTRSRATRSMEIGVKAHIGIASLDAARFGALVDRLDARMADLEALKPLLRPGTALGEDIVAIVEEKLGADKLRAIAASRLGVPKAEIPLAIAERLVREADEAVSFLSLGKQPRARSALAAIVATEAAGPLYQAVDGVVREMLERTRARLTETLDALSEEAKGLLAEATGEIGPLIDRSADFLTGIKSRMRTMLDAAGEEVEIGLSLSASRTRKRREEAEGSFFFALPEGEVEAAAFYKDVLRRPGACLSVQFDPEERSAYLQKLGYEEVTEHKEEGALTIAILADSLKIGSSSSSVVSVKRSLSGLRFESVVAGTGSSGEKTRKIEISNAASLATKLARTDNLSRRRDGLRARLQQLGEPRLDQEDAQDLFKHFVKVGVVTEDQIGAALGAIKERQAQGTAGGDLMLDLSLTEAASDAVFRFAAERPRRVRRIIAASLLRNDPLLLETVRQLIGVLEGTSVEADAVGFLMSLRPEDLDEVRSRADTRRGNGYEEVADDADEALETIASLARALETAAALLTGEAAEEDVDAAQDAFLELDEHWAKAQIPFLGIDRPSRQTLTLFDVLERLAQEVGHTDNAAVIGIRFAGESWRRF